MKEIITIAAVDQFRSVLSVECAVLFIDVSWSIQCRQSRRTVREWAATWNDEQFAVMFYRVDLSGQEGTLWDFLRVWLESQSLPAGELMYGGYGEVVWLRRGSAVDHVQYAATRGKAELMERTVKAASMPRETANGETAGRGD